ncbi:metallophosphoesterase [Pseudoalteromonas phenolica]|nr:metallophosphoesterase [Pseudoalteromonas phenolica]
MKIQANAILKADSIRHITLDDAQRVFVVGDIAGNLDQINTALDRVGFTPNKDVLIALGDMIDRGPDSMGVLKLLRKLNSLTLLGNHEHLMIESILGQDQLARQLWHKNGGSWSNEVQHEQLEAVCHWLLEQSLSMVVEYQGHQVGLSHTLPIQWSWGVFPVDKRAVVSALLWDRELVKRRKCSANKNVDFSIHGHNSTQVPFWIANSYHIDTAFYGRVTMVELSNVIDKFKYIKAKQNCVKNKN